ncbi:hypothetical protein [Providencia sp. PROV079]|uniref:hypothetical protein n=1 Tax=Providencia sp. PROV079 TaxID=2949800 RepID=UPI00234AD2D9|nr:hypothetical protein [Providencia sp. PROV079]
MSSILTKERSWVTFVIFGLPVVAFLASYFLVEYDFLNANEYKNVYSGFMCISIFIFVSLGSLYEYESVKHNKCISNLILVVGVIALYFFCELNNDDNLNGLYVFYYILLAVAFGFNFSENNIIKCFLKIKHSSVAACIIVVVIIFIIPLLMYKYGFDFISIISGGILSALLPTCFEITKKYKIEMK